MARASMHLAAPGLVAALVASCVLDLSVLTGGDGSGGAGGEPVAVGGAGGEGAAGGGAGGQGGSQGGGGAGGSGGGGGSMGPALTVTTVDAYCANGRVLDSRKWKEADEVVLQLHCSDTPGDCTAGTTLAGLGTGPACPGSLLAQHDGCPVAVAAATGEHWFFSAHATAAGINGYEDFPNMAAQPLALPGKRVVAMTGGDAGNLTYAVGPEAGGGPTEIWKAGDAQPLSAWSPYEVVDLDGYFVIGTEVASSDPVLVMAAFPPSLDPTATWDLVGCETPVRVEHHQEWEANGMASKWLFADRVAAVCDAAGGGHVYATEPLQLEENLRTMALPTGMHPTAIALSLSGDELWVWDDAGKLAQVDVVNMALLGTWTLAPSYSGAALSRLASSNELVLGGPTPGALTLIQLGAAISRCADGVQSVVYGD